MYEVSYLNCTICNTGNIGPDRYQWWKNGCRDDGDASTQGCGYTLEDCINGIDFMVDNEMENE